jgi:hypothetical protein
MNGNRAWIWLVLAVSVGCRAAPGASDSDGGAVRDITANDMRARISFLAADRLRGRGTPSRGLEIAAAYIASEFRRFGLDAAPGGYMRPYKLVKTEMGDGWSLAVSRGDRRARLRYRRDFVGLPWAGGTVEGRLRFVGAEPPEGTVEEEHQVVWVADLAPGAWPRQWMRAAARAGAAGLIFVVSEERLKRASRWAGGAVTVDLGDTEPTVPGALTSREALARAFERLGLSVEPLESGGGVVELRARVRLSADLRVETLTAPNVLGILRGRDRRLRDEYVLVSAHMDHLGVGVPVDGDSIYNGADDNASGTAALLEVAEAMAGLREPPRRSVAFLAVSGEEKGLLGSTWFVTHPPIPLGKIVADLNVDMIGRNWEDTISVIGKPYSSLGFLVDSVAAAHGELGLTVVGDLWPGEGFFFRSDHFNFARNGIPAVFFFNGVHEDYHRPSDEVDKIRFDKAARVARLVFEVALAIANAEERPRWDPEAWATIVDDAGGAR